MLSNLWCGHFQCGAVAPVWRLAEPAPSSTPQPLFGQDRVLGLHPQGWGYPLQHLGHPRPPGHRHEDGQLEAANGKVSLMSRVTFI